MKAVLPSGEMATEYPKSAAPTASEGKRGEPCWAMANGEMRKAQTAPALLWFAGPPTRASVPSSEIAAEAPNAGFPVLPMKVMGCGR